MIKQLVKWLVWKQNGIGRPYNLKAGEGHRTVCGDCGYPFQQAE